MSDPQPEPVIIDGADTPLAHVTLGEAMLSVCAELGLTDTERRIGG